MRGHVVLRVKSLTKHYYSRQFFKLQKTTAVDLLNLEIEKGEIFGFLGPNGAGKTTTLNMIVGIAEPSYGEIEIFGRLFRPQDVSLLSAIGYVPEATLLPGYLTVAEFLNFCAQLFDISKKVRYERIAQLLEMVGMLKERNILLKNLSMGQRRLIDIIQALINDPDLILLDEPTVYLDPLVMEHLRTILSHLKESGKTVIFSSHVISEIEKIADRVAIIDRGKLLKVGPKKDFISSSTLEEEFLRIVKNVHT
ncbi:MAG: ABC transporter ATP-binding protein [Candidatus Omnitrophota bacterium]